MPTNYTVSQKKQDHYFYQWRRQDLVRGEGRHESQSQTGAYLEGLVHAPRLM